MRTVLVVLAAAAVLSGCGAAARPGALRPPDRRLSVPGGRLWLHYPAGWKAEPQRMTIVRGSAGERLRVGSFAPPEGPRDHPHARLPAGGAFILLYENDPRYAREDPARPARFTSFGQWDRGAFGCMGYPWSGYLLRFRDHHRSFVAVIALGPRASAATRLRVLQVLDSIRVGPLPRHSVRV